MSLISRLTALRELRSSNIFQAIGEFHANNMGYRQMGLKYDDLVPVENPVVHEALRRLSPQEAQDRMFRIRRAFALSVRCG
jgi:ubiquinol-cytochrome c reductase subunit 7